MVVVEQDDEIEDDVSGSGVTNTVATGTETVTVTTSSSAIEVEDSSSSPTMVLAGPVQCQHLRMLVVVFEAVMPSASDVSSTGDSKGTGMVMVVASVFVRRAVAVIVIHSSPAP